MQHVSNGKDTEFFLRSGVAGAMAALASHAVLVPIDVLKTRMQLDPKLYPTLLQTTRTMVQKEGWRKLLLGLGPTASGYFAQGFFKYSLYELFKDKSAEYLGKEVAASNATLLYILSGTAAEAVADIALAPFEAVRIRMVASSSPWASSTADGMRKLVQAEGFKNGLYKGLPLIMMKQIPYTAVKFAVFEATTDFCYNSLPKEKLENISKAEQLSITAIGGLM